MLAFLPAAACATVVTTSALGAGEVIPAWETEVGFLIAAMATDSQNNVYTCSGTGGGISHVETVKIDPDGNIVWTRSYATDAITKATWLTVDSADNVIVTGWREVPGAGLLTLKYSPAGVLLWEKTSVIGGGARAFRVAVDAADNVYVTGQTFSSGNDYLTVKYDPNGNLLWSQTLDVVTDTPTGLAVTAAGKVVVTGSAAGQFGTVCYDTNGNELWSHVAENGVSGANAVVFGPGDVVYVCGPGAPGVLPIVGLLMKYDADGNLEWESFHGGATGDRIYSYSRLAVAPNGDIVTIGGAHSITDPPRIDWATVRTDDTGSVLWERYVDGLVESDELPSALAIHSDGSIYVAGTSGPPSGACPPHGPGTVETVTTKYDAAGNEFWREMVDCSGQPTAVLVDSQGAIVVNTPSNVVRYVQGATAVLTTGVSPASYALESPRPNPFRAQTTIQFDVPVRERATVSIVDVSGRIVKRVASGELVPGRYRRDWDGRDEAGRRVASGVYFVRLETGSFAATRKMTRLR
jgi:hypothetical protein